MMENAQLGTTYMMLVAMRHQDVKNVKALVRNVPEMEMGIASHA